MNALVEYKRFSMHVVLEQIRVLHSVRDAAHLLTIFGTYSEFAIRKAVLLKLNPNHEFNFMVKIICAEAKEEKVAPEVQVVAFDRLQRVRRPSLKHGIMQCLALRSTHALIKKTACTYLDKHPNVVGGLPFGSTGDFRHKEYDRLVAFRKRYD